MIMSRQRREKRRAIRGVSEIETMLPIFAQMRRYREAELSGAQFFRQLIHQAARGLDLPPGWDADLNTVQPIISTATTQ